MAGHCLVIDLVVRHRCLELTVPVHQAVTPVDQPVDEEAEEGLTYGGAADRVHGEPLSVPVSRAAHLLLLSHDSLLILVLPRPDALHQGLPTDVVARLALELEETLFHHGLRSDSRMVRSGLPECIVPHHPVPAYEQVLHHIVHGVAHVERPGNVGQRHHDDIAPLGRAVVRKG